jgi:predicted N-acetyltransferase YhbS
MSAGVLSPISTELPSDEGNLLRTEVKKYVRRPRSAIIPATHADHGPIYCFLAEVFGGLDPAEFRAERDDPFYQPLDRLLLRRGGRIIGHVHLTHRVMQFGSVQVPAIGFARLAVAEECCGRGLGTHLLSGAEEQMAQSGALVGLLRTRIPHYFRRTGWALCGQPSYLRAGTHAVLARLAERGLRRDRHPRLHIRPWRQWEEKALVRVYRQNLAGSYGLLQRTQAYWHWLLGRQAHDQIYVALDGTDLWDLTEATTRAVGYAVIRGERILELMTTPGRNRVAAELLARVCGDAVEYDRSTIVLHAPADHPLSDILHEAGGWRHDQECEARRSRPGPHPSRPARPEVQMARLLDPLGLLRLLCGEFLRRAKEARLPLPQTLGLLVDGRKYQIEITPGGANASPDSKGRSYLSLNVADFTRLLLGQLDWDRAEVEGRLVASTALARQAGRALFPHLPFWRPLLDDLAA